MTVIKINAITVPDNSGDELAKRFAARAGAVDDQPGFEGFELLQPTDDRNVWLVVTRWADQESFDAWVSSKEFAHGHRGADKPASGDGDGEGGSDSARPVSVGAELWSYQVAGGSTGNA
ncbi:MAG: antibiotic biosynthesis monooxygenase [Acidimicrobiales bacterium]|nr:antibiotic biosynthesis monooxygenase [Acidimicrobiales bacterium]